MAIKSEWWLISNDLMERVSKILGIHGSREDIHEWASGLHVTDVVPADYRVDAAEWTRNPTEGNWWLRWKEHSGEFKVRFFWEEKDAVEARGPRYWFVKLPALPKETS